MRVFIAAALLAAVSVVGAKDWWENGNFYQIYPRSFRDSNGDGIGDLNGVTEKLQYLKDIGFTAVWLSPIFKSPMVDFGYDISDFYQIHPEYGTLEDFENMIKKAKEVGIKIILDFVPNHTSDENEWFKKSVNKEGVYKDFYVWHPGTTDAAGQRVPPSNWVSQFRYSACEWNEVRQEYYLHQFAVKQPDLNYRNPAVVNEMKNVMRFWLAKGVSGFRIDACPFLFEKIDQNGNYPDEPLIDDVSKCPDKDDYCHLKHPYTNDQPETMDMVYQWRELTDQYKKDYGGDTRVLLTEAYTNFTNLMRYYGDGKRNGSYVPFNFDFMGNVNKDSTAADVVMNINKWLNAMPKDVYANWVLGNHDNKRLASRFGVERADLLNIMLQTLPGIAVTYNGEELAMTDVFISWEETVDPQACNANPNNFNTYSRDPARTPYQWDASTNAGFTPGSSTWLPVSPEYKKNNALMQLRAPHSHLQIFKKLIRLRQEPSLQDKNSLTIKSILNDIVIYQRATANADAYIIILNFGKQDQTFNINDHFPVGDKVEIVTTSIQSNYNDGEVVNAKSFMAKGQVGTVVVRV